ncbi:carbohydrate binding family 9 domain-containing protein [Arcticibacterium luteifluviistationis]|uniref:carbohydrate binding family 9 domain-containing protein n=1 Tax=Arcticibacterium luteifluviistationis TaxID=1784714 RepID=UPI0013A70993|nr:carbohydrate binding family 9 domain-containing protein [Arcticibacterium luteifluviistationis]
MRFFLIALLQFPLLAVSQSAIHDPSDYFLKVYRSAEKIDVDGEANERVWAKGEVAGEFWQLFPRAEDKSEIKTNIRAAFDDDFVYFLIEAFDSTNTYVSQSLKRDASIGLNDGVAIILDPINKKSNGFVFSCTPYNVQSEYQYGTDYAGITYAWDNKWYSAVKRLDDRYVVEMAIPFKTLRYNAGNTEWGINILRSDLKSNQLSSWTNIPVQFSALDLGYLGTLQFDGALGEQKSNISIIPYAIAGGHGDSENSTVEGWSGFIPGNGKNDNHSFHLNAGFDAKVAINASLNLDFTINPDFSQVEVDQQVTNLTRYSILYPERRTFFLENSDLFSNFGSTTFKPFFSRSLGLDENANAIPILYGARLSGNVAKKVRVGVMNMQTLKSGDFAAQNYTAASVHQRIGARSLIKGYFLNREATGLTGEELNDDLSLYGRNAGLEVNLIDRNGVNQFWAGYHKSIKKGIDKENDFYQLGYSYSGRTYSGFIEWADFSKDYYADMGFINRIETHAQMGASYTAPDTLIRAGFKHLYNHNTFTLRPKDSKVVQVVFGLSNFMAFFDNNKLSDKYHSLTGGVYFKNTSGINVEYKIQEDNLLYYFPLPTNKPLAPGNYKYSNVSFNYLGDERKNFVINGGVMFGKYYNADIRQYNLSMLIRKQPYYSMMLSAQFNDLLFPMDYGRTKLWLIGPKLEATLTNKLFWTTFLQFNTQENNFNINSRIQYRYSPMSDFFLVYSDNYYSNSFVNKNRAIVLKFNYWFSL